MMYGNTSFDIVRSSVYIKIVILIDFDNKPQYLLS